MAAGALMNDTIVSLMGAPPCPEVVTTNSRSAVDPRGTKFCQAFSSSVHGVAPEEDVSSEETSEDSSLDEDAEHEQEEQYFSVVADEAFCKAEPTEQDVIKGRCMQIRELLRARPTLPLKADGSNMSVEDVATGVRLPLYSCPFFGCNAHFSDRARFLHHVAGGVSDTTHREALAQICCDDYSFLTPLDYVSRAVGEAERERWPLIGLSTTRRALNHLCRRYNDDRIKCLSCFICCQLRTTCEGYAYVDLNADADSVGYSQKEIALKSLGDLQGIEVSYPGTLLNNCSYDLWRRRYRQQCGYGPTCDPWSLTGPLEQPLSSCLKEAERHISRWAMRCPMLGMACMLYGCTEDICCGNPDVHQAEYEEAPYVRTMCPECRVFICDDCDKKLRRHDSRSKFQDGGTIPMSLSNDHYYGHVNRYIVENNVTWLECAASCMIWSTMLVYYLEAPFGHLMGEEMGNAQGRTHVRGNLFSFNMPWEDIERCCHQAVLHANGPDQQA